MYRTTVCVLALFTLAFLFPAALLSQTSYGSINGTVRDASAAVIPLAQVTLTNVDTGVKSTRETNASGVYVFINVAPGNHTLNVQAKGFSTAEAALVETTDNGRTPFEGNW